MIVVMLTVTLTCAAQQMKVDEFRDHKDIVTIVSTYINTIIGDYPTFLKQYPEFGSAAGKKKLLSQVMRCGERKRLQCIDAHSTSKGIFEQCAKDMADVVVYDSRISLWKTLFFCSLIVPRLIIKQAVPKLNGSYASYLCAVLPGLISSYYMSKKARLQRKLQKLPVVMLSGVIEYMLIKNWIKNHKKLTS